MCGMCGIGCSAIRVGIADGIDITILILWPTDTERQACVDTPRPNGPMFFNGDNFTGPLVSAPPSQRPTQGSKAAARG